MLDDQKLPSVWNWLDSCTLLRKRNFCDSRIFKISPMSCHKARTKTQKSGLMPKKPMRIPGPSLHIQLLIEKPTLSIQVDYTPNQSTTLFSPINHQSIPPKPTAHNLAYTNRNPNGANYDKGSESVATCGPAQNSQRRLTRSPEACTQNDLSRRARRVCRNSRPLRPAISTDTAIITRKKRRNILSTKPATCDSKICQSLTQRLYFS